MSKYQNTPKTKLLSEHVGIAVSIFSLNTGFKFLTVDEIMESDYDKLFDSLVFTGVNVELCTNNHLFAMHPALVEMVNDVLFESKNAYAKYTDTIGKQHVASKIAKHGTSLINQHHFKAYTTPPKLIDHVLDSLPDELWVNPNLKWYDPCCGYGGFLAEVVRRLTKGLTSIGFTKKDALNHILNNMIYANDIDSSSLSVCQSLLNINPDHISSDDFIEKEHDMKFDIIIGNPPFQDQNSYTEDGEHRYKGNLYPHFIEKCRNMNPSYMGFVLPAQWTTAKINKTKSTLINHGITHLAECSSYFPNIDQPFVFAVTKDGYVGNIELTNIHGEQFSIPELTPTSSAPLYVKEDGYSILNKLKSHAIKGNNLGLMWYRASEEFKGNNIRMKPESSEIDCIPVIKTTGTRNSDFPLAYTHDSNLPTSYGKWKVVITGTADIGYNGLGCVKVASPEYATSYSAIAFCVDSEEEALNLQRFLTSPFTRYIINNEKKTTFNSKSILASVPIPDLTVEYTNKELGDLFDLSDTELEYLLTVEQTEGKRRG